MFKEINLTDVEHEAFTQYAGAVSQSRAFVDARDFMKPSQRQINYCLITDKFTYNKPFRKTPKAVGSLMRVYIHGDASAVGILMREAQNFALRYPLAEVEGNCGNLLKGGNWAAPRYTSTRLSALSSKMFEDIDKDTIDEWRDNYDDTEQYPAVIPSKGFYNIVNGTMGIGIGLASSVPQFNIKDVNHALEVLLLNPDATFEELYCVPDFATGGYLINEEEVKAALKYGSKKEAKSFGESGASCKLRAVIDYDKKDNALVVKELPYSVYTETICEQLEEILEDKENNPGIDRFNDLTGINPKIKIYLIKGADPDRIMKYLYKNTSLQYHFGINMTMLDKGRFPKVFTWKEALQAHIDHEQSVYRRGFEFDLKKIDGRIHIINGLLVCLASIDEVITTIKASNSTADAKENLIKNFLLDEAQAKAVLDMKLSRLAHLEVKKLKDEKEDLIKESERIHNILDNEELFNNELIQGWRDTTKKYGDEHRTKVIHVVEDAAEKEIEMVTPEDCVVVLNRNGEIKRIPSKTFKVQNRNGKGVKTEGEVVFETISTNTIDTLMIFTNKGKMYKCLVDDLPEGNNTSRGVSIYSLLNMTPGEKVAAITSLYRKSKAEYVVFITKEGMIKKSKLSEYTGAKRKSGIVAIKLGENDAIANVVFMNDEDMILVTKEGMSIKFETDSINPIGRNAAGVKAIKLNEGDSVMVGIPIHNRKDCLAVFTENGIAKKTSLDEFPLQNRGGKGVYAYKDTLIDALLVSDDDNILICGKPNSICISAKDIPLLSRTGSGNVMIKSSNVSSIVKL